MRADTAHVETPTHVAAILGETGYAQAALAEAISLGVPPASIELNINAKQWISNFLNAGGELTYWSDAPNEAPRFGVAWKLDREHRGSAETCNALILEISDPTKPTAESLNELGQEVRRLAINECERFGLDAIRTEQPDGSIVGPLAVNARWDGASREAGANLIAAE